jgi:histone H3/H4
VVAIALREIRHYQSDAMAGALFIQKKRFMMIVREILQDIAGNGHHYALLPAGVAMKPGYRIERDALIALQLCTESLFTNIFEMAYASSQELSEV